MTRRVTPTAAHKLGKSSRDREREREAQSWWDEERESFPQFCMNCESQFVPQDDKFLYCSEACRRQDHKNGAGRTAVSGTYELHAGSYHSFYAADTPEPKDIIPRASPSRPSSTYFSPPASEPVNHTSAISALRSLSINDPSPPSPTLAGSYTNLWPFSRGSSSGSPDSYTRPSAGYFSSTYDTGYYGTQSGYTMSPTMERPLPSRKPNSYHRPKSIELVTPMIGR